MPEAMCHNALQRDVIVKNKGSFRMPERVEPMGDVQKGLKLTPSD